MHAISSAAWRVALLVPNKATTSSSALSCALIKRPHGLTAVLWGENIRHHAHEFSRPIANNNHDGANSSVSNSGISY
jgi:hypothetical protein